MSLLKERPVRRLVEWIFHNPYSVLGVTVLSCALAIWLGTGIKLKSKIQDLLPESAVSVQAMGELTKRLGSADILVVALMSSELEKVKTHLPGIAAKLEEHPDIRRVQYRQDVELIDRNALIIFPSVEELEDNYTTLRSRIREEVKKRMRLLDEDDEETAADGAVKYKRYTFDWVEHERDEGLSNLGRTFREGRGQYREYFYNRNHTTIGLKIFPTKPSGDLSFCRHIIEVVQRTINSEVAKRLGPIGPDGTITETILAGGYRNALKQSDQIKSDMIGSIGFSLGLLVLIIAVYFRSFTAVVCILTSLIVGIFWTVGFVSLAIGYLNIITAFIFAVLLGLGIDFGIHFYQRYREERAAGLDPLDAMVQTHLHCGEASVLAAVTTSCAFAALMVADFRGFSQFGGVAAVGVLLSLLSILLVFPALVFISERFGLFKLRGYSTGRDGEDGHLGRPFPLAGRFMIVACILGVSCYIFAPQIEFEMNFGKLGQKHRSVDRDSEVVRGTTQATSPAVIFAQSAEEARSLHEQLEAKTKAAKHHPWIKSHQSLFSLIPEKQEEKRTWVKKICRKLKRKVKLFKGDSREGADEILKRCDPQPFQVADLPPWVRAKFSDKDGKLGEFIFVSPRGTTSDGRTALAFSAEMQTLKGIDGEPPVVSGKPMVWADVLRAMKRDGLRTTAAALLTVLLLLSLFERKVKAVCMIMLPITLGVGFSIGAMALLGIKLNFFNMLAVPTILGIGVDDGVHMYHRYTEVGSGSARYVVRTTGMAALLTTLTTSVGFGSLLTANHFGLNSLGLLSIIGIAAALLTTVLILPAAMQWSDDRRPA